MSLRARIVWLATSVILANSCDRNIPRNDRQGSAVRDGGMGSGRVAEISSATHSGAADHPATHIDPRRVREKVLGEEPDAVCSVSYAPDGRHLLTGSDDGTVKLWSVAANSKAEQLDKHGGSSCATAFEGAGRWFATGSWARTVFVYDAVSRRRLTTVDGGKVKSLAFGRSDTLVASNLAGELRVFSLPNGKLILSRKLSEKGLTSVAVSPADDLLAAAGYDGKIYLVDSRTLSEVRQCDAPGRQIFSILFSSAGTEVLTAEGSADQSQNEVVIRSTRTCAPLRRLTGHTQFIYGLALSPDGTTVASAGLDTTIRLFQYDGAPIAQMSGHREAVHAVAFSPDGQQLASVAGRGQIGGVAGADNTVRIWTWPP